MSNTSNSSNSNSSVTTNEGFSECPDGFDVQEWWKKHNDDKEAILSYAIDIRKELDEDSNDDLADGTSDEEKYDYICPLWKVSDRLRDDKDVVKAAIASYVNFDEIDDDDDDDDAIELSETMFSSLSVKHHPLLNWAGEKCRDDKDLVMYAIKYDSRSMKYASSRLRDNEDL